MILVYDNINEATYTVVGFCYDRKKHEFRYEDGCADGVLTIHNCDGKIEEIDNGVVIITLREAEKK